MGQTKDDVLGLEDMISEELTNYVKDENLVVDIIPKVLESEVIPEVITNQPIDRFEEI